MTYADKLYPIWAEMVGWFMASVPVVLILSLSVIKFIREPARNTFLAVSPIIVFPSTYKAQFVYIPPPLNFDPCHLMCLRVPKALR